MGNCLNPASKQGRGGLLPEEEESLSEMRRISQLLRDEDEAADALEYQYHPEEAEEVEPPPPEAASAPEGLKVKVVLTRAELEWLMAQIKAGDAHSLRDVLHHMHAAKQGKGGGNASPADKHGGWRPRLESIIECQETLIC